MPDASRRTIRRTTVIYWMLLIYIIAALAWWFISLEKQNNRIAQLQYQTINPDKNSLSVLQYGDKVFAIDNETKKYRKVYSGRNYLSYSDSNRSSICVPLHQPSIKNTATTTKFHDGHYT